MMVNKTENELCFYEKYVQLWTRGHIAKMTDGGKTANKAKKTFTDLLPKRCYNLDTLTVIL